MEVKYPTDLWNLAGNDPAFQEYEARYIYSAYEWCTNAVAHPNANVTLTLRYKILRFLRINSAPRIAPVTRMATGQIEEEISAFISHNIWREWSDSQAKRLSDLLKEWAKRL